MWTGNFIISIIANHIERDITYILREMEKGNFEMIEFSTLTSIKELKKRDENLTTSQCVLIFQLCLELMGRKQGEECNLIVTAPMPGGLDVRRTALVYIDMIKSAKKSILLTGYSVSNYADEIIEELIKAAEYRIPIDFYVDDYESKKELLKPLLDKKLKNVRIYNFQKDPKSYEALHAKVLIVDDERVLITSSNLSGNGMNRNIELGVQLRSQSKAAKIRTVFGKLQESNKFKRIIYK